MLKINRQTSCVRYFILAMFAAFLTASCSKVTEKNYVKIQPGMDYKELCQILGEPDYIKTFPMAGFHGSTAVWKAKSHLILVQLFDNKVRTKHYQSIHTATEK